MTLAYSMLIDHEALKKDDVHEYFDWLCIKCSLASLNSRTRGQIALLPLMIFQTLFLQ